MTQTATPPSTTNPERKNPLANLDWRRYVIYIGFAVVFLFFAITLGDDGFLTGNNLLNIVRQTATVTIIAVGMTYVIAAAEIDLERRRHSWPGQCRHRHDHRQLRCLPRHPGRAGRRGGGRLRQRRAGRNAEDPLILGHTRDARHRSRCGPVDHQVGAATDPVRPLQQGLRVWRFRTDPWIDRLDDHRRGHRRDRAGQDPIWPAGAGHRWQPRRGEVHWHRTPRRSPSRCC